MILQGSALDVLKGLDSDSVQCIVTSPPYYGLRSYNAGPSEIGQEPTLQEFLSRLVEVFRECRRVLKKDGVMFLNCGDSYCSSATGGDTNNSKLEGGKATQREAGKRPSKLEKAFKPKDRMMVPARLAIALQDDGWWLRDEIIWHKPNPMPSSVQDRTTPSHEMIYLLTKSAKYFYNAAAIRTEPNQDSLARYDRKSSYDGEKPYAMANPPTGRKTDKQRGHSRQHDGFNDRWDAMEKAEQQANGANCRSVWTFSTQGYPEAHFATFPEELPRRCILAGSREGDTVLDPFGGSGTTGAVAKQLGRKFVLIELNPDYVKLAEKRISKVTGSLFAEVPA